MRTLIIGCGYVGRRVATAWQERGHEVLALTRSEDRAHEFRQLGWEPVIGDVTTPGVLAELAPVDIVLYAVGLDRTAGKSQREVYVDGLSHVLDALKGRAGKWLYVSSSSVYGQDDGSWIDETSPCDPKTPNGQVCLEAERLLRSRVPEAVILRLSGIYGPGRLIARTEVLKSGQPLTGRPDAWLNLIHVDDVTNAVLAAGDRAPPGATYLVTDDCPILRHQFYESICQLIGAPAPNFTPTEDAGLNKRCYNTRLKSELQVELAFPTIETGLPHALELGM